MSLQEQQAALVAALAGLGPPPLGFDAARLHAAAESLARKRRHAVVHAWPGLEAVPAFQAHFAAYAQATPLPVDGGPLADGRWFVDWLDAANVALTDAVRLQACGVDLRFVTRGRRWRPGPWVCVRSTWLGAAGCRWMGLRVRLAGWSWEWQFRVRVPSPRR